MGAPLQLTQREEIKYINSLFSNPKSKFYDAKAKKSPLSINAQRARNEKRIMAYKRLLRWRRKHRGQYRAYQRSLMAKRAAARKLKITKRLSG